MLHPAGTATWCTSLSNEQNDRPAPPALICNFALHPPPPHIRAERILQLGDGLRTVTLVARDAANLAIALGACGEDAAELWRSLATRINPSLNATTPAAEGEPPQPDGWWVLLCTAGCWLWDTAGWCVVALCSLLPTASPGAAWLPHRLFKFAAQSSDPGSCPLVPTSHAHPHPHTGPPACSAGGGEAGCEG